MKLSHRLPLAALFCSLSLAAAFSASAATPQPLDRIIAVVNENVILQSELEQEIHVAESNMKDRGITPPPADTIRSQVLERLILMRLQTERAKDAGIKIDERELNDVIAKIAEQNKMGVPEFKEALAAEGIVYKKFREDIRNEILLARLREREVDNRVNVTESEVDNFLTTQSSRQDSSDEYEISHILIRAPEDGSPEDLKRLREKAEDALKKLQAGEDFGQVSARVSDAPNALEGGKLGWKTAAQVPALFLEALKPMQVGQLSGILRSPNGFHILKLTDRRGGNTSTMVQQTHTRHILIKTSEVLSETEAKRKIDGIKQLIDNGEDFGEAAKRYSNDGSAANGGDLGWVNPGDTVPQFEKAMNALQPGQISDAVRSPFGWHLIQVLERRNQDMTREAERMKARQEIRQRKADEAYQDWVRELRDRAYVELRLEDKY